MWHRHFYYQAVSVRHVCWIPYQTKSYVSFKICNVLVFVSMHHRLLKSKRTKLKFNHNEKDDLSPFRLHYIA